MVQGSRICRQFRQNAEIFPQYCGVGSEVALLVARGTRNLPVKLPVLKGKVGNEGTGTMQISTARGRFFSCLAMLLLLAGCTLPRSGPYYSELVGEEPPPGYDFEVMNVTPEVTRITRLDDGKGFDVSYLRAGPVATQTLAPGDVLAVTVWENIDQGLLSPAGIGTTPLPQTKVDSNGKVFVPYVGVIPAAGRTIGQLRQVIRDSLSDKTLNPQVDVFPVETASRRVAIQGAVNAPGIYPIEKRTRHLLPMLAKAGGTSLDPAVVRVKVRRGGVQGVISLEELYDNPGTNIALRPGDNVILERDRRIFTALGAVSAPATVQFPTHDVSLARALGIVGGLSDQTADPTGVFIFRMEPVEIARRLFPEKQVTEPQRVAYIVDLTKPEGIFLARDFKLRDDDTIYVTVAPYVRWLKIMRGISPIISFGGSARALTGM